MKHFGRSDILHFTLHDALKKKFKTANKIFNDLWKRFLTTFFPLDFMRQLPIVTLLRAYIMYYIIVNGE